MSVEQEKQEVVKKSDSNLSSAKPWGRYLIEFILLFTAVFLGFLTENYRERMSEIQQAEELAQNLYDELIGDSVRIYESINLRHKKDSALAKFINYVQDSSLQEPSKTYVLGFYEGIFVNSRFSPKDVILEQLKNSGSLRYFRSKEIQQLVGSLSVAISNIRTGNNFELEFIHNQLIPFIINYNDQRFFSELTQNNTRSITQGLKLFDQGKIDMQYRINNISNFHRETVTSMLGMHRYTHNGTTVGFYDSYININKKLLSALRKEYKIINNQTNY